MLLEVFRDVFVVDGRIVLLRNKDSVNSDGLDLSTGLFVFNGDLNLSIRSHPRADLFGTDFVESFDELVAQ